MQRDKTKDEEGFIKWTPDPEDSWTGREEFVNRIEAFKEAKRNGQLFNPLAENDAIKELYSEDLW